MTSVALAFAVLDVTGSTTDLGLVLAARAAPLVLFLLVGGVVADRVSRRATMVGADVVRLCSQGALGALLISGHARLWQLLFLAAVHGTATAFFNPASTGLLPAVVSAERLQAANGLRGLAVAIANIAGPAAAGAIVALSGPGWAIAADAVTFGISALLLTRIIQVAESIDAAEGRVDQSLLRELREGFRAVRSRTWVWSVIACAGAANMMFGWFMVLGAVAAKRSLGGASAWALILAAFSVGSLLGGILAMQWRPRRPLLAGCAGLSLLALPAAVLATGASATAIAGVAVLGGASSSLFNALWATSLQQHIPRAMLSRVSAYDWLGATALNPVGLAIAGPVASLIGLTRALWIAAAVIAAACAAPLAVPAVRDLPRVILPPDGRGDAALLEHPS